MEGGRGGGERGRSGGEEACAEAEFAAVKTSVWWDIENCSVLKGCDAHTIARNISSALANVGYKGMVSSISAYGDTNKIPSSVQHALNSTGVSLNHVPAGVKDASDKKILVDMIIWAVDNPAPANYLLISGDRDFSNALHQLRMRRYNILLAHAPNVSPALVAAAKCVWKWSTLIVGGPPLNSGTTWNSNGTGDSGTIEKSKYIAYESTVSVNPSNDSSQLMKSRGNGRSDDKQKTKLTWKNTNNSQPVSSRQHSVLQQDDQVVSIASTLEVQGNAQVDGNMGKHVSVQSALPSEPVPEEELLKEAPHKFSIASKPSAYSGPMKNLSSPIPDVPNNLNTSPNNHHPEPHQLSKPRDLSKSQPCVPKNLHPAKRFVPQPLRHHRPALASSSSLPDINRLNLCDNPITVQQKSPSQMQNANTRPNNNWSVPSSSRPYMPSFCSARPLNINCSNKIDYPAEVLQENPFYLQNVDIGPKNMNQSGFPLNIYTAPAVSPSPARLTRPTVFNHLNAPHYPGGNLQQDASYLENVDTRTKTMNHSGFLTNICIAPDSAPYLPGRPDNGLPAVDGNSDSKVLNAPGFPEPSTDVQFHIGTILLALNTLKTEKLAPTEANITDCIHFGEINLPNFNVMQGLDHAIGYHMVVKHCLGSSLPLYIVKNDRLWKCVNIMDGKAKYPNAMWDAVKEFISSSEGCSALLETQNRYQAAILLKKKCLKNLTLGDILNILHLAVNAKKWIIPHVSGWKPIKINILVQSDKRSN